MVPRPRRVLLNDAGAIPYLSGIAPLDGLGLGGFRGMPFARASVQGVAAVVELIERLPPDERPDVMAIYPAWWGEVATRFGRRIDAVRIVDNVICAADEKVIYAADWSLLDADTGGIDIGDLLDERAHGVEAPGAIVSHVLNDGEVLRWDAGRSGSLSFVAERAADAVAVRIDADSHGTLSIGGVSVALAQAGDGRWREVVVRAPIARGARVAISAPATVALHHIYLR
jgi:hypothetical protein